LISERTDLFIRQLDTKEEISITVERKYEDQIQNEKCPVTPSEPKDSSRERFSSWLDIFIRLGTIAKAVGKHFLWLILFLLAITGGKEYLILWFRALLKELGIGIYHYFKTFLYIAVPGINELFR